MAAKPLIPEGAEQATLGFGESRVELVRDTTGVSRWTFTGFRADAGPDPIARGVLTHAGAETFAAAADTVDADGARLKPKPSKSSK